ncbi:MAG: helix-turn-helix transcriptional regulator [Bacteroidales bacterium]
MKERILQLLQELNLSSSQLAEEIDVQRSSISHILAGRNKPSFVFIEKLLKRYPKLNSRWLLLGEGSPFVHETQPSLPFHETENKQTTPTTSRESNIQSETVPNYGISNSENNKKQAHIEKIVIFYSDNHFEEYLPKKSE